MLLQLIKDVPRQLPVPHLLLTLTLHSSKVIVQPQEVPIFKPIGSDPHLNHVVSVFFFFSIFFSFTKKSFSSTLSHITENEYHREKSIFCSISCAVRRHKLNLESSRPTFSLINGSFPCAHIPTILYECIFVCL